MEIFELLIAVLSVRPEGIDGRTAIQKLGYFTSVKLKKDTGYAADLYGPFSQFIATNLQNLVETDFVSEKGRRTIHDRTMYSYSLTEDGYALSEKIEEEYPREYETVRNIVEKCSRIVNNNFYVLSWAAKVHFILVQSGKPMTYEDAISAGRLFSWRLGQKELDSASRLLLELDLIKKT
jgi:uncharacterized protein YwgA